MAGLTRAGVRRCLGWQRGASWLRGRRGEQRAAAAGSLRAAAGRHGRPRRRARCGSEELALRAGLGGSRLRAGL